jgi:hypothetical protein
MLDFVLLVVAIYLALVGASVTILAVAFSGWYRKKCMQMTKDVMGEFEDMFQ